MKIKVTTKGIWIVTIFLLVSSCARKASVEEPVKYFEGEVKFHVSSKSLDKRIPDEVFQNFIGESMIGIVKEDYYKTISINKQGDSILMYFDLTGLKIYYDDRSLDTIYWYPLDANPGELIDVVRNEKPKKKILGEERESITIKYISDDPYIDEYEGTYYFHPDYQLNRTLYKNHKESFWNLFVNETGAISIRNEIKAAPLYSVIYEAYEIVERDILMNEFELDSNKVIMKKELFTTD